VKLSSPTARADATQASRALWLFAVALIVACVLRLGARELRPMHVDETTQSVKLGEMLSGKYQYDPRDHHGPTLLYATVPWMVVMGRSWNELSESDLRLIPALFGISLLLLLGLIYDGLDKTALAWAALFTAVSPLMVFYSRYYIMEVLLVWFTFACIACGWRYFMSRRLIWLLWCGVCAGAMHATKETCVLHFSAMAVALAVVYIAEFFSAGAGLGVVHRNRRQPVRWRHALVFVAAAAGTSMLLFSQFFTEGMGVVDSVMTYFKMMDRAGGQGHEKSFTYYLGLLWGGSMVGSPASADVSIFSGQRWAQLLGITPSPLVIVSEAIVMLLAIVGCLGAFLSRPSRQASVQLVRFLAVYGIVTFFIYSSISYKTPWCIMGAWHALILMAGYGVHIILRSIWHVWTHRVVAAIVLLVAGNLALQSWRVTRDYAAYARNPYNYSMTAADCLEWVGRIYKFGELHPDGQGLVIAQSDFNGGWPLPWYLARRFPNYQWQGGVLEPEKASIMLLSTASEAQLLQSVAEASQTEAFDARFERQVVTLHSSGSLVVYVEKDLWQRYVAGQPWPESPVQQ
jgi:hypothetical protein